MVFFGLIVLGILVASISLMGTLFVNEVFGQVESEKKKFPPTLIDPNFKIQVIHKGLDYPTKMTFVDNDTILIAQKANGQVAVIKNFNLTSELALDLNIESGWERGFTSLSSVNHQGKNFVFVYYTESVTEGDTFNPGWVQDGNKNNGNKLVRYQWDGSSLVDPVLILHPIPYSNPMHQSGAMAIHDNYLYIIIGDNYEYYAKRKNPGNFLINNSQERNFYDRAVIFKIDFEGNASPNHPFTDPDLSKYYSYGIRNGYGLAFDPLTNNLWDTENGKSDFDEINLIFPGFNSGWMKTSGPLDMGEFSSNVLDLTSLEGSGYSEPEFSWKNAIGVTAIEFIDSKKYGLDYQNDILVGDVHGKIYHFELNEDRDAFVFSDSSLDDLVVDTPKEEASLIFGRNLGIITDIKTGPDGYLYVISMVHADSPGWGIWARNIKQPDVEKQGSNLGAIFRIIPLPVFKEIFEGLSPKQQVEEGILPTDVICKDGLELIFKSKNNSPNCVKPNTAKKLVERGWAAS